MIIINRDQQKHNFTQAVGGLITAHADGVTFSDDRKETTRGYVGYIEEKAKSIMSHYHLAEDLSI